MDAAIRISQLIATCSDSQRLYLQALSAYRAALKEVLAREQALRTVLRDREILVNRLIKIGNKKVKDGQEADHQHKLDDAQRELQACESASPSLTPLSLDRTLTPRTLFAQRSCRRRRSLSRPPSAARSATASSSACSR